MVRGIRNLYAGFTVARGPEAKDGKARSWVYHTCGWGQRTNREEVIRRMNAEYAEYLKPHYTVMSYETSLLVSEKE